MVWQADHNEPKEAQMPVEQMQKARVMKLKARAYKKLPIQLCIS